MANRTVKVDIPREDPDDLITLAETIIAKHEADPANSKLSASEVLLLKQQVAAAKPARAKAVKMKQDLQAATEEYQLAVGTGKGQTSTTPGTVYNLVNRAKKTLLIAHEGKEEQLETYGMKVKVSLSKPRGPRKPKP